MKRLVLVGTGGFAREAHQAVLDINRDRPLWEFLGFVDDDRTTWGRTLRGAPILGGLDWLAPNSGVHVAVAIGSPAARRKVVHRIRNPFATLVHPSAWLGSDVTVGEGSILLAGAQVETENRLGKHVILNLGASVGHESSLSDFVILAPGVHLAGRVKVEEGVDLGINSCVIQDVTVGAWSIIGAGAAVVEDVPPNVTSVGVPAKVIKRRAPGWHL